MNEGITLLLERMKSHPEEFQDCWDGNYPSSSEDKWGMIKHSVRERMNYLRRQRSHRSDTTEKYGFANLPPLPFLTDEEVEMVYDRLNEINAEAFHHYIMKNMLAPSEGGQERGPKSLQAYPANTTGY